MINIKSDSRKVKKGDIFVALNGISSNGEDYVDVAIKNGASKIIVESDNKYSVETIKVKDTRAYLNEYLNTHYKSIIDEMNIIGLTGTNGKTTTCYLIYQALNSLNIKCAYIGTIGYYLDKKVCSLSNTSPDVCDLFDLIVNAYDNGYKTIVMEASSQGLAMNRLEGIRFNYAIFTNLTQDHLDYHKTMENYALAKQLLFKKLKTDGISILNADDSYKDYFITDNTKYYGELGSDYKIHDIKLGYITSFKLDIGSNTYNFESHLIGKYNIYNLVCCIALLNSMNISIDKIINIVKTLSCPPGRMQIVRYNNSIVVIDYAHTPDAMENIYNTVNEINKGKIYTVFGCTGDRDRTKRPIMMDLSTQNSFYTIITSDDLHNEDFNQIVSDMIKGNTKNNYEIIKDRAKAIEKGISLLKDKDILLILGKGHEEFIIVGNNKIPFNDKEQVEKIISKKVIS